jgi:hypothetical protein
MPPPQSVTAGSHHSIAAEVLAVAGFDDFVCQAIRIGQEELVASGYLEKAMIAKSAAHARMPARLALGIRWKYLLHRLTVLEHNGVEIDKLPHTVGNGLHALLMMMALALSTPGPRRRWTAGQNWSNASPSRASESSCEPCPPSLSAATSISLCARAVCRTAVRYRPATSSNASDSCCERSRADTTASKFRPIKVACHPGALTSLTMTLMMATRLPGTGASRQWGSDVILPMAPRNAVALPEWCSR